MPRLPRSRVMLFGIKGDDAVGRPGSFVIRYGLAEQHLGRVRLTDVRGRPGARAPAGDPTNDCRRPHPVTHTTASTPPASISSAAAPCVHLHHVTKPPRSGVPRDTGICRGRCNLDGHTASRRCRWRCSPRSSSAVVPEPQLPRQAGQVGGAGQNST